MHPHKQQTAAVTSAGIRSSSISLTSLPYPPSRKSYATENAYTAHLASKRHRENLAQPRPPPPERTPPSPDSESTSTPSDLSPESCLFCLTTSSSLAANLEHMASTHSFFVPDADYLVDLPGLIAHLAEKIAHGNVCIYCNGRGRELHSLDAVRKHMIDKGHCKIAYDTEVDKLDLSDYYDFTSSYPSEPSAAADPAWEDVGDDSDDLSDSGSDHSDAALPPDSQLTYGDTEYELVLPSGARIGHRSMMRYYAQSFHGIRPRTQDPDSGAALVRRLLADKNSALVPRKGGFGAFGQGTDVIKARNKGEAREAGRHIAEFRDQRRREDFKTKVAFINNSQKHFRDPLLQ